MANPTNYTVYGYSSLADGDTVDFDPVDYSAFAADLGYDNYIAGTLSATAIDDLIFNDGNSSYPGVIDSIVPLVNQVRNLSNSVALEGMNITDPRDATRTYTGIQDLFLDALIEPITQPDGAADVPYMVSSTFLSTFGLDSTDLSSVVGATDIDALFTLDETDAIWDEKAFGAWFMNSGVTDLVNIVTRTDADGDPVFDPSIESERLALESTFLGTTFLPLLLAEAKSAIVSYIEIGVALDSVDATAEEIAAALEAAAELYNQPNPFLENLLTEWQTFKDDFMTPGGEKEKELFRDYSVEGGGVIELSLIHI